MAQMSQANGESVSQPTTGKHAIAHSGSGMATRLPVAPSFPPVCPAAVTSRSRIGGRLAIIATVFPSETRRNFCELQSL